MLASFRADMLPHFPVVALSADADVRSRKRSLMLLHLSPFLFQRVSLERFLH